MSVVSGTGKNEEIDDEDDYRVEKGCIMQNFR